MDGIKGGVGGGEKVVIIRVESQHFVVRVEIEAGE